MPHSYANNLLHVVFSTRERKPTIPAGSFGELWAILAGIGRNHRLTVIKIGGMADHVHILFTLPADVMLAHAVQVFKANSSRWMHETRTEIRRARRLRCPQRERVACGRGQEVRMICRAYGTRAV